MSDLSRSLKEEKHGRKSAENNITQLQEELADLKATKFSLEKVSYLLIGSVFFCYQDYKQFSILNNKIAMIMNMIRLLKKQSHWVTPYLYLCCQPSQF